MRPKVVDLDDYRLNKAAQRVSGYIRKKWDLDLNAQTTPADLPDEVLSFLIEGRAESTRFLQEMVIRMLDMGRGVDLSYLPKERKMAVLDSYFFLLDQFRFEAMARLGWLDSYPAQDSPVALSAIEPERVKNQGLPLDMSKEHSDYAEFDLRRHLDGEVIVRRLIPEAIDLFREQIEQAT